MFLPRRLAPILRRLVAVFALGLIPTAARASMNFYTYRIQKDHHWIYRDSSSIDSVSISYVLTQLGPVSLEGPSLTVTSKGSYLEVVEEATLSGNLDNRPRDITGDFLFQGTLPIPPGAAVYSFEAYHADTVFNARLKRMKYSLDEVFLDSAALAVTLNNRVVFLQQLSDQGFEATLAKLTLGEPTLVRIRYTLPMPGSPTAPVTVPVLFHPSGQAPQQIQIHFEEAAKGTGRFQWLGPAGKVTLDPGGIHAFGYEPRFTFQREEPKHTLATLQTTGMAPGIFPGNYLVFKGGLDDSIMAELSHPMETVFLWRWNPPYDFVQLQNGLKTLSIHGQEAISQARAMRALIGELSARGHRFGVWHSIAGRKEVFFPPAAPGTADHDDALKYLDGWNEQRLYDEYKDYHDGTPPWAPAPWSDSNALAKSRREFLWTLDSIRRGFGKREEALRHVVMLGTGSATATFTDLDDPDSARKALDSASIVNQGAFWLGVNLDKCLRTQPGRIFPLFAPEKPAPGNALTFPLPVFQPASVEFRTFNQARSQAVIMPFGALSQRQAFLKSASPWSDSLELQGIDVEGRKTRVLALKPRFLRLDTDTGLARLWAADPNRMYEMSESDLGMRYGILTKGTYFGAAVGDGVRTDYPGGVPVLPKVVKALPAAMFQVRGGLLAIQTGSNPARLSLEVFDMQGRKLMVVPLGQYRSAGGFAIPLSLFQRLRQRGLILVLRGGAKTWVHRLMLGGHR